MAELKEFELIMRCTPVAGMNGKGEVVIQAEKVSELVRCKDCIHRNRVVNAKLSNGAEWESLECTKHKMLVTEDWFCKDGGRRKDA